MTLPLGADYSLTESALIPFSAVVSSAARELQRQQALFSNRRRRVAMKGRITKLSVAGAACYAIWGCLHVYAGYNVFMLGDSVDPGMVRGRLHQGGWNLFFFGVTAIEMLSNVFAGRGWT
jgi:hypothetical protein